ncbi:MULTISPECIES: DUF5719 family protein [unclassified Microbacterium]|uniref:DUF5719 family protein n=1 Tax=unclassified Microbacterium TaxID=2609290 RepID=UPI000AD8E55B|nr:MULTISPECIES: DUF5719 family protein [unclassified Microbacterium]MBN9213875.1 large extracellular alpha-helical protein [Microbacterium sp.]
MSAMSAARTASVAVGVVVAAALVAAAVLFVTVDAPGITREPVSLSAQPPATASVATCTGPLLASGRDSTQASLLTDAAAQNVTASAAAAPIDIATLSPQNVTDGAGPSAVTAQPVDGARTDLAAAGSAQLDDDDLAGFAASACVRSSMDSWLVAGSATTGAADLVVLGNPGDVAALVTLTVYGSTGLVAPPAGAEIVVAPGTQRVIPLAALALGEENPIVRVTSTQAPVQASLQASLTRVLTPGGVDQIAAVGAPDTSLVIPGVRVALAPDDPDASDIPTTLRLVAPASDGTATVTIRSASGAAGEPHVVPLTAGVPLQLDLTGLAVGTYTVSVSATTPITGGVWATTGFTAGSDFGWFTGAALLTEPALVAVADGPSPVLTLAADEGDDQTVTVTAADGGDARDVVVPSGASVDVSVTAGSVYRIDAGSGAVRAAISYAADGALAGYPVQPGDAAAAAILVYPR